MVNTTKYEHKVTFHSTCAEASKEFVVRSRDDVEAAKKMTTTFLIILWIFKKLSEIIYIPVCLIRLFKKSKKCPPVTDKLLLLSASELAQRIRRQKTTSVAVIQAYISRINEVNPLINAVIENRFDSALLDAKTADDLIRNSGLNEEQIAEKYPLLGVPLTIKGSIAVAGMVHSAGSRDHLVQADSDAPAVKHARDAGAIPLLVSNVPELCLNWECSNKLIGITSNPYDSARTPGGSSGGEASLLGCGASLVGLGSDLGGSVRLPAHYCGIFGHKPSPCVVSPVGHYPECKNKEEWKQLFTIGPMTRYASDLKLVLNIIAEPDIKKVLKLNQSVDLRNLKVYYMEDTNSILSDRLSDDVIDALEKVITHFDVLCTQKCKKIDVPRMKYCAESSFLRAMLLEMDVDRLFQGKDNQIYYEFLRLLYGKAKHEPSSLGYCLFKRNLELIPKKTVQKMYSYLKELREDFLKILGDDDAILILPTTPSEATYHNDMLRKSFNFGYCSTFNMIGFPATSCPISFSKNGLPIGLQVVAGPNLDRLTLSVAEEFERVFGGWKFS